MAKGYLGVVLVNVSDPDGYKAYIAENAKPLRKFGGRFLARGGKSETPEGQTRSRVVVVEFPNYAAALECYRSPEYAKAMALRDGKSVMDLTIVEGYDGPQPSDGETEEHPTDPTKGEKRRAEVIGNVAKVMRRADW